MKLYTSSEQTAKLIELGFEKPKSATTISWDMPEDDSPFINANSIEFDYHYSIGELIEKLDSVNETVHCRFGGVKANLVSTNSGYEKIGGELIDLLFDLCVKLKEEGVI